MYSVVFVVSVLVSILSGGISDEATSGSTNTGTEEVITHVTEFIQSTSPFPAANISGSPRTCIEAFLNTTGLICEIYDQCAWYTYVRHSQWLETWELHSCYCPEGMECVRYKDVDIISALEYRCRNITSSTTEETMVTEVSTTN